MTKIICLKGKKSLLKNKTQKHYFKKKELKKSFAHSNNRIKFVAA